MTDIDTIPSQEIEEGLENAKDDRSVDDEKEIREKALKLLDKYENRIKKEIDNYVQENNINLDNNKYLKSFDEKYEFSKNVTEAINEYEKLAKELQNAIKTGKSIDPRRDNIIEQIKQEIQIHDKQAVDHVKKELEDIKTKSETKEEIEENITKSGIKKEFIDPKTGKIKESILKQNKDGSFVFGPECRKYKIHDIIKNSALKEKHHIILDYSQIDKNIDIQEYIKKYNKNNINHVEIIEGKDKQSKQISYLIKNSAKKNDDQREGLRALIWPGLIMKTGVEEQIKKQDKKQKEKKYNKTFDKLGLLQGLHIDLTPQQSEKLNKIIEEHLDIQKTQIKNGEFQLQDENEPFKISRFKNKILYLDKKNGEDEYFLTKNRLGEELYNIIFNNKLKLKYYLNERFKNNLNTQETNKEQENIDIDKISIKQKKFILEVSILYKKYLKNISKKIPKIPTNKKIEKIYKQQIELIDKNIGILKGNNKNNNINIIDLVDEIFANESLFSVNDGILENFVEASNQKGKIFDKIKNIIINGNYSNQKEIKKNKLKIVSLIRDYDIGGDLSIISYNSGDAIRECIEDDVLNVENKIFKRNFDVIKELTSVDKNGEYKPQMNKIIRLAKTQDISDLEKYLKTLNIDMENPNYNQEHLAKNIIKIVERQEENKKDVIQLYKKHLQKMNNIPEEQINNIAENLYNTQLDDSINNIFKKGAIECVMEGKRKTIEWLKNKNDIDSQLLDMYADIEGIGEYISDKTFNKIINYSKQIALEIIILIASFGFGNMAVKSIQSIKRARKIYQAGKWGRFAVNASVGGAGFTMADSTLRSIILEGNFDNRSKRLTTKNFIKNGLMMGIFGQLSNIFKTDSVLSIKLGELLKNTFVNGIARTGFKFASQRLSLMGINISLDFINGNGDNKITWDEFVENTYLGAMLAFITGRTQIEIKKTAQDINFDGISSNTLKMAIMGLDSQNHQIAEIYKGNSSLEEKKYEKNRLNKLISQTKNSSKYTEKQKKQIIEIYQQAKKKIA